jgi:MscS family membrane protein
MQLPSILFELSFLDVRLWQWTALLALIVVAAGLSWILTTLVVAVLRRFTARSRTGLDDRVIALAGGPVRLIIGVGLFASGTQLLDLPEPVGEFFAALQKGLTLVGITWLLTRMVDLAARAAENALLARNHMAAMSVVPLGRRTVKVLVLALATLAVLQNFGINVTGILAGLGIGGLAVALAAQKTVENLFGGLSLIADQPVRVGAFCRFGDRLGTVEEIGLRSTRVRTLDRTVVTVPNAEFASLQLENYTQRDRIWFHTTLGVRYETTPEQMRHLLIELKKLLISHPKVDPDPARVRFVGFGACSLDLEVFAYILTTDFDEFLAIREDLLLRIAEAVAASGSGFAFPSRTLYVAADSGLDSERRTAAESQVRRWRDDNALDLPRLHPDRLEALKGTLEYPPKGAAVRK